MRVTLPMLHTVTKRDIAKGDEKLYRLSRQISSGRRLQAAHDDPHAWARSLDVTRSLRQLERHRDNLEFAEGMNRVADSALNHVHDLLTRAKEIGIAANTLNSPEETEAYAEELDQIMEEIARTVNESYNKRSVFEGTMSQDEDGNWVWNPADPTELHWGSGQRARVSVDGWAFIEQTIQAVTGLKAAIEAGNSDEIGNSLANLEQAMEQVRTASSRVGVRLHSYERQLEIADLVELHRVESRSQLRDTDVVEAITELQQNRTALEAALKSTALVQDLNLVQYI